jgi:DNA-binding transcriptional regulator YhcF (GntR family)
MKGVIMSKYNNNKNGGYMQFPRNFWTGKNRPIDVLSHAEIVLYLTLKECEHAFTGYSKDTKTFIKHPVYDKDLFYCSNKKLKEESGLSLKTIKRAKRRLEQLGFITVTYNKLQFKPPKEDWITYKNNVSFYRMTNDYVEYLNSKPEGYKFAHKVGVKSTLTIDENWGQIYP